MPPAVVSFSNVSKAYPIYAAPSARFKELICLNRVSFHRDFWALRDINFSIQAGQTFCIIGENGSGKSTLLQMVAGILAPSKGTVSVTGRVAALLELGSGFNPEFSGRDNVYLNAAILGLTRREVDASSSRSRNSPKSATSSISRLKPIPAAWLSGLHSRSQSMSTRNSDRRRSLSRRRYLLPAALHAQSA